MIRIIFLATLFSACVACPDIQIGIEGDTCETPESFNKAFEPVYSALYNYIDWEEFYGYPPVRQSIDTLAATSFDTVEKEIYSSDGSTVVFSSYGGYAVQRGDWQDYNGKRRWNSGRQGTRSGRWSGRGARTNYWNSGGFHWCGGRVAPVVDEAEIRIVAEEEETITAAPTDGTNETVAADDMGRFLEVMEGDRELQGFNCYPPKQCKDMGWCCTFCPCKNRRLEVERAANDEIAREAARMEEEAIAQQYGHNLRNLQQSWWAPTFTNVCDWLASQPLPGCLSGATIHCSWKGERVSR